jgi:outer membrane protein assembly factor BamB
MRPAPGLLVAVLALVPAAAWPAQAPRGALVPVGARVKADARPPGQTTEGTVLAWRGDTLVLRAQVGGDTVRIAPAALKNLRVLQSPALWRYASPSEINAYTLADLPRPGDAGPAGSDAYQPLVLLATRTELAGVDPATGKPTWSRRDLADLKGVALDVVGATGYAVVTRGERMDVLDLRTGETRWHTATFALAARGWLPLLDPDTLMLLYGRTATSPAALWAVEIGSGRLRWRQDSLFVTEPKVFGSGGVSYLFGHQPPLADSDTTLVLYLSADGPMRLDARTGALLWRSDALRGATVPALRDGYAPVRAWHGTLFVPSDDSILALRAADGRPAWAAAHRFKHKVIRMEPTREGLLARGSDWLDLLDPATGGSRWRAPVPLKQATRIVLRGDTVYVAADKKILAIQIGDGAVRTIAAVSFKEGESPSGFTVWEAGIILNSWHNLMLVDRGGAIRYHRVYPSPKQSFGEALKAGAGADVLRPTTRWAGPHIYFFTGAPDDAGREGFSLVKVEPAQGREAGRLWFDERVPAYSLEPTSATAYYQPDDRTLDAVPFADRDALAYAARNGHAAVVERLLDMGVEAGAANADGWTALHLAARAGHPDVVRLLVARGAQLDARTADGWTPWMLAAREGHEALAGSLRDAGAESSDAAAGLLAGWHLARRGRIPEAVAALTAAATLDSTLTLWPAAWQVVCWHGGLAGQAATVLESCDRAVAGTPPGAPLHGAARLARAIARTLTGDLAGAATDLEATAASGGDEEDAGTPFQAWIDALREGRDPFTPALLEALRRR